MWFTERGANKIGRISGRNPGAVTEFPIAAMGSAPDIIVVGARRGALVHGALQQQHRAHAARAIPPASPASPAWGWSRRAGSRSAPTATCGWSTPTRPARTCSASRRPARRWGRRFRSRRASTRAASPAAPTGTCGSPTSALPARWHGSPPAATPTATNFPVPAGSPIDVIRGGDGNIWYAGQGTTVGKGHAERRRHRVHEQGGRPVRGHARARRGGLVRGVPGQRRRPRRPRRHHQPRDRDDRGRGAPLRVGRARTARSGSPRRPATAWGA